VAVITASKFRNIKNFSGIENSQEALKFGGSYNRQEVLKFGDSYNC